MKRQNGLHLRIANWHNLTLAYAKSLKGKRYRKDVVAFAENFQDNINDLVRQLTTLDLDIGHYTFFKIWDPKPRSICAASFPERVLHHAVMNVCEPVLERYAIDDSYACRKGKGNSAAIKRAKSFVEKCDWYMKMDVRKYFDSIDHRIAMDLLARRIKDKKVLAIFERILDSYHTQPGKGLPIGNLISQHLANFYLRLFDHWLQEERKIGKYVRYMDDMLVFAHSKANLKSELFEIKAFLRDKLALELKHNVQINRTRHGLPFLGLRLFPHTIRLSPRNKKRFVEQFVRFETRHARGIWTEDTAARHMEALFAFAMTADTEQFRRSVIGRFGVSF